MESDGNNNNCPKGGELKRPNHWHTTCREQISRVSLVIMGETRGNPMIYCEKKSHKHVGQYSTLGVITSPAGVDAPETKSQKTEDKYPLTSEPTGLCVIINNENFQDGNTRRGTEKDAESLAAVFSWLGFQVLMCKDQTASDMARVTKLLADLKGLKDLRPIDLMALTLKDLLDLVALTLKDLRDLMDLIALRLKNPGDLRGINYDREQAKLNFMESLSNLMDIFLKRLPLEDLKDMVDLAGPKHLPNMAHLPHLPNMAHLPHLPHLAHLPNMAHLAELQKCKLEEWSNGRFTPLSRLRCLGLAHGDAFVCCVLSHGDEDVVSGVDGETLPISDITSAFNGEHCPALLGKPKVFFIQACQGPRLQPGLAVDSLPFERQTKKEHHPIEADFLVSKATVAKYQALRNTNSGSIFIQSLCEQLRKGCARGEDILKILVRVNAGVSNKDFGCDPKDAWKQMPEFRATLRQDLVFLPYVRKICMFGAELANRPRHRPHHKKTTTQIDHNTHF